MSRVRGMVFDLDGTLIDSALDFDRIRSDMGLPRGKPILEALATVPEGSDKDRMRSVLRSHELAGAERASLFPGVDETLVFLREQNIPTAILTRNSRESTEIVLRRLALQFDRVLTREDAPPKPDPTGLIAICRHWRVNPEAIPFCGDYRFDLEAGRAAGMPTVLYAPGDLPDYAPLADHLLPCFTRFAELWTRLNASSLPRKS